MDCKHVILLNDSHSFFCYFLIYVHFFHLSYLANCFSFLFFLFLFTRSFLCSIVFTNEKLIENTNIKTPILLISLSKFSTWVFRTSHREMQFCMHKMQPEVHHLFEKLPRKNWRKSRWNDY